MSYMKRNVNLGLLFLIVATLIAFAGFTTYYQKTFFNLSESYEDKMSKIDYLVENLELEKTRLNETSYQLNIKKEREKELSGKYETLRDVKEQLEKDKALLQDELTTAKSELSSTEAELSATKSDLDAARATIAEKDETIALKNSEINTLNSRVNTLCNQVISLGGTC